jgi:hypothetical protein
MDHSSTLDYSSRLPVSVCGTGSVNLSLEGFLGSLIRVIIRSPEGLRYYRLSASLADLPTNDIPTAFNVLYRKYADLSLLRHPIAINTSTGILTSCPSAFAFAYALGPD